MKFNVFAPTIFFIILQFFCWGESSTCTAKQAAPDTVEPFSLSATEKAWLAEHSVWRIGVDPEFAPFEFFDDQGKHTGIGAEYLQFVAEKLGITLEFSPNLSWEQVIEGVKKQTIDVLPVVSITPDRLDYLVFSKPYLKFPTVVVCRRDEPVVSDLSTFAGRKIALVKGYAMTEQTLRMYSKIQPVFVDTVLDGLSLVASSKADGFVGDLATVSYKMTEFHLNNIQVASIVNLDIPGFSMAVRREWQPLAAILDKVLATMPAEQHQEISHRWLQGVLTLPEEQTDSFSTSFPLLKVGLVASLLLVILALFFSLFKEGGKAQGGITQSDFMRQSVKGQKVVIYFNVVLVIIVGVLSWWALDNMKQTIRADWRKSMETVRDTAQEVVSSWAKAHSIHLRYIAAEPKLVKLVQEQIAVHTHSKDLFTPQLESIRTIFSKLQSEYDHIGFFIIAPDGTNIGSMRDSNMGAFNLIGKHRPALLARAFAGETVFIPPIPSDVPLGEAKNIHDVSMPPTMFFATPVKDKNGVVLAVLTERFRPHGEFSHFFELARLGNSGETYAFDKEGMLLSASRFHKELRGNGQIDRHEQCILSVTITDPSLDSPTLTRMAKSAIQGKTGVDTSGYNDYRGVPVFGAWTWNNELGIGIACEMDISEAMQSYYQGRMALLVTMVVVLVIISTFLWVNRRTVYRLGLALSQSHQNLEKQVLERTRQLSQTKKEQDLIFSTMGEALFVQNAQGEITFLNQAAVELFGYKEHELLGESMHDVLHHSNIDGSPINIADCEKRRLAAQDFSADDDVFWHKNGHAIPVEYTSRFMVQNDNSHGMVVVCHDISERLSRHKALLEREAQLQLILDSAPIAIGISNELKQHVFGNRRLFEQIRIEIGEKTEKAFVDPAQRLAIVEELDRKGIVKNALVQLYAPDGSVLDTLATYIRSEYKGEPAIIAWFYDISMQKQAEMRLDQARQLAEDANRTKSEFLANMSHELRTPLNAIIGMSQLALQSGLTGKQHHYIDAVNKSGEILLTLINDILDFSRIEAERLELEEKAFAITDVFDHLAQLFSFQSDEKQIELIFSLAPDIPRIVIGDKFRLNQIVTNLVSNAIKFTHKGKVEVNVSIKKLQEDTLTLLCHVQDSGVGMTGEAQQQLFQPFVQADSSVARKFGGSGLGLVICKHLVEMMGGSIWLESKVDVGTTFSFTVVLRLGDDVLLPDGNDGAKQQNDETGQAIAKLAGLKVLLAEDNDFNRDLAMELLTGHGLDVVSAVNGLEVLKLLEEQTFAGILMDCQMPEMDGYTATQKIRKNPKFRDLPILAMTANVLEDDRKRAFDAGMNDHISKPIDLHELFTTMAKWFVGEEG